MFASQDDENGFSASRVYFSDADLARVRGKKYTFTIANQCADKLDVNFRVFRHKHDGRTVVSAWCSETDLVNGYSPHQPIVWPAYINLTSGERGFGSFNSDGYDLIAEHVAKRRRVANGYRLEEAISYKLDDTLKKYNVPIVSFTYMCEMYMCKDGKKTYMEAPFRVGHSRWVLFALNENTDEIAIASITNNRIEREKKERRNENARKHIADLESSAIWSLRFLCMTGGAESVELDKMLLAMSDPASENRRDALGAVDSATFQKIYPEWCRRTPEHDLIITGMRGARASLASDERRILETAFRKVDDSFRTRFTASLEKMKDDELKSLISNDFAPARKALAKIEADRTRAREEAERARVREEAERARVQEEAELARAQQREREQAFLAGAPPNRSCEITNRTNITYCYSNKNGEILHSGTITCDGYGVATISLSEQNCGYSTIKPSFYVSCFKRSWYKSGPLSEVYAEAVRNCPHE